MLETDQWETPRGNEYDLELKQCFMKAHTNNKTVTIVPPRILHKQA
jgi:hypothetical protein